MAPSGHSMTATSQPTLTATKGAWSRAAVIVAADWRALFGLTRERTLVASDRTSRIDGYR
jgi:hypothetical protein